ncbi:MAG TPA: SGNH/GDSL hydrolase family protein, partial [Candidatus Saccharimonadales bacterium]|nr:SGNH/GDSL hydrolase family protein [Candidatus Saccharimonadales bacterium]
QGIGATSPARGYVGLVAEKLRQASGRPVRVINLSRSGAVIADVFSDQLPRLTALKPDVVTVAVGGNDVWRGASLPELEERFGRLAAALPAGSILADVPCFGGGQAERKVQAISPLVEQLCREHDLVFAPLHQTTHPHHRDRRQYARDWFHPSDAGYVVWAQALWAGVERQLNANDRSIPKHAY